MKLALMAVTKKSVNWAMKYETLAKEKDGGFKTVTFRR
jgi:hypothetical protein